GGKFDYSAKATDAERLETVAAKSGEVTPLAVTADDWPTFRKDNARSGITSHAVAAKVAQRWEQKLPARVVPTAPVTAAGLVLVSGTDGVVRALDAESGKPRWTAYTGGPVNYPPALANGRAYVGSNDGWIYCLE